MAKDTLPDVNSPGLPLWLVVGTELAYWYQVMHGRWPREEP